MTKINYIFLCFAISLLCSCIEETNCELPYDYLNTSGEKTYQFEDEKLTHISKYFHRYFTEACIFNSDSILHSEQMKTLIQEIEYGVFENRDKLINVLLIYNSDTLYIYDPYVISEIKVKKKPPLRVVEKIGYNQIVDFKHIQELIAIQVNNDWINCGYRKMGVLNFEDNTILLFSYISNFE